MTTDVRPWHTTYQVVVLDPAATPRVLVTVRDGEWAVPVWEVEEPPAHDPDLGRIVGQVRERLGLDVGVLRYVEPHEDEAARRRSGTWVMERRGEVEAVEGSRWVTRTELAVGDDEASRVAAEVVRELEDGSAPANRRTWSFPGWLDEAEAWMREQLRALGREPSG